MGQKSKNTPSSAHPAVELKAEISAGQKVAPFLGVFDAFSASIAAKHSPNLFLSGFSMAASYYGLPDIGYIAWSDMVNLAWRIRTILPEHRLLVDIDDGYVDVETACHVVQQLELMGCAMVMLEDQGRPRRCGHFDNKIILPLEDYIAKLERVLATRKHMLVLARTDASGDEVFRRVEAISKTAADVILVDGVKDLATLRKVRKMTDKPILFNHIAGGKSPALTLSELRDAGVALSLYSTPALFSAQESIDKALGEIMGNDGRLPVSPIGVKQSTELLQVNMNRYA